MIRESHAQSDGDGPASGRVLLGKTRSQHQGHVGRPRLVAVVQEQDVCCLADQRVVGRLFAGAVLDAGAMFRLQQDGLLALGRDGVEVDGLAEEVFVPKAVS